ncbi:hypothetical protein [Shouchella clausii]|jgi:hypothetical protein|uniref:Uncharacterized protein n=1 Tax=Shouchella clausii TaxID=79880 RepID=A0A268S7X5_SHOCL|nr:hypothetical protein [Shouchella clausii]PAD43474.1 hypothetical protein CHH54_06860 [Bacillus sp. 7520-S]SPU18969.1 Uncharacterised protein [Niallia circulans]AST95340.1 hypothetical protein BC8716_04795 [Shouchella clausii]MBU8595430.1 hypothetical protein [Shouchella clausii]MCM3548827.1 hypothetical protein [Shouchella clausii]
MYSNEDLHAVEERAKVFLPTATSELSAYLRAIEEYVRSKRKDLGFDQAEHLETQLLVHYGLE